MPKPKFLSQGTRVSFKVQGVVGTGEVCGIAMTPAPGIGATYIIKPADGTFPDYEYTHISLPSSMLTVLA